ncbi:hypothetical protein LguiB_028422 [Lonicera macranthoides]
MPLSSISPTASSRVPIAIPSLPNSKGFSCTNFRIKREVNLCGRKVPNLGISLDLQFVTNSVSRDSGASVEYDVPFPNDYSELLQQNIRRVCEQQVCAHRRLNFQLLDWNLCYPGPWKVLRKAKNKYVCVHQQETMPSLKEVALDILPSA